MRNWDSFAWFGFGGSFCAGRNVVADWAAVASTQSSEPTSPFRGVSFKPSRFRSAQKIVGSTKTKKKGSAAAQPFRELELFLQLRKIPNLAPRNWRKRLWKSSLEIRKIRESSSTSAEERATARYRFKTDLPVEIIY